MQLRKLGRTGLMVSVIGLGGIPLQRVGLNEAVEVVRTAVEKGINFIDTARAYTDSEEKLGEALENIRDKVILATKSMARSKEDMAREVDVSLKALKVDYIDLYQLHNVKDIASLERVLAPDGALAALKEAQKAGKVRFIGITGHIPPVLVEAIKKGHFDTVQFPFNPIETVGADELLPLADKMDLGTIAMKPFAGGAIKSTGLALRYILHQGITTAIPGMDGTAQVIENVAAGRYPNPLTEEEKLVLDKEAANLGGAFCRRCEYCQPCPRGIDIPLVFLLEGYWTRYGLQDWAVDRYRPLKAKASDCVDCGQCEEKCPYSLPIREMLKEARLHLE